MLLGISTQLGARATEPTKASTRRTYHDFPYILVDRTAQWVGTDRTAQWVGT